MAKATGVYVSPKMTDAGQLALGTSRRGKLDIREVVRNVYRAMEEARLAEINKPKRVAMPKNKETLKTLETLTARESVNRTKNARQSSSASQVAASTSQPSPASVPAKRPYVRKASPISRSNEPFNTINLNGQSPSAATAPTIAAIPAKRKYVRKAKPGYEG